MSSRNERVGAKKQRTTRKGKILWNIIILISILCTIFLSSYLAQTPNHPEITIIEPIITEDSTKTEKREEEAESLIQQTTTGENQQYVASKNGKRYYPNKCSAANTIKEENKIWFATEEEAKNRGLTRTTSKSCTTLW